MSSTIKMNITAKVQEELDNLEVVIENILLRDTFLADDVPLNEMSSSHQQVTEASQCVQQQLGESNKKDKRRSRTFRLRKDFGKVLTVNSFKTDHLVPENANSLIKSTEETCSQSMSRDSFSIGPDRRDDSEAFVEEPSPDNDQREASLEAATFDIEALIQASKSELLELQQEQETSLSETPADSYDLEQETHVFQNESDHSQLLTHSNQKVLRTLFSSFIDKSAKSRKMLRGFSKHWKSSKSNTAPKVNVETVKSVIACRDILTLMSFENNSKCDEPQKNPDSSPEAVPKSQIEKMYRSFRTQRQKRTRLQYLMFSWLLKNGATAFAKNSHIKRLNEKRERKKTSPPLSEQEVLKAGLQVIQRRIDDLFRALNIRNQRQLQQFKKMLSLLLRTLTKSLESSAPSASSSGPISLLTNGEPKTHCESLPCETPQNNSEETKVCLIVNDSYIVTSEDLDVVPQSCDMIKSSMEIPQSFVVAKDDSEDGEGYNVMFDACVGVCRSIQPNHLAVSALGLCQPSSTLVSAENGQGQMKLSSAASLTVAETDDDTDEKFVNALVNFWSASHEEVFLLKEEPASHDDSQIVDIKEEFELSKSVDDLDKQDQKTLLADSKEETWNYDEPPNVDSAILQPKTKRDERLFANLFQMFEASNETFKQQCSPFPVEALQELSDGYLCSKPESTTGQVLLSEASPPTLSKGENFINSFFTLFGRRKLTDPNEIFAKAEVPNSIEEVKQPNDQRKLGSSPHVDAQDPLEELTISNTSSSPADETTEIPVKCSRAISGEESTAASTTPTAITEKNVPEGSDLTEVAAGDITTGLSGFDCEKQSTRLVHYSARAEVELAEFVAADNGSCDFNDEKSIFVNGTGNEQSEQSDAAHNDSRNFYDKKTISADGDGKSDLKEENQLSKNPKSKSQKKRRRARKAIPPPSLAARLAPISEHPEETTGKSPCVPREDIGKLSHIGSTRKLFNNESEPDMNLVGSYKFESMSLMSNEDFSQKPGTSNVPNHPELQLMNDISWSSSEEPQVFLSEDASSHGVESDSIGQSEDSELNNVASHSPHVSEEKSGGGSFETVSSSSISNSSQGSVESSRSPRQSTSLSVTDKLSSRSGGSLSSEKGEAAWSSFESRSETFETYEDPSDLGDNTFESDLISDEAASTLDERSYVDDEDDALEENPVNGCHYRENHDDKVESKNISSDEYEEEKRVLGKGIKEGKETSGHPTLNQRHGQESEDYFSFVRTFARRNPKEEESGAIVSSEPEIKESPAEAPEVTEVPVAILSKETDEVEPSRVPIRKVMSQISTLRKNVRLGRMIRRLSFLPPTRNQILRLPTRNKARQRKLEICR